MKRKVLRAFGSNLKSASPLELVEIILDYAYNVQCGRSSVQYWFWLHEPTFTRERINEDRRRPSTSVVRAGRADETRTGPV